MKNFKSFIQSDEVEREMQEAREYLAVHPKTDKIDHVSDSKEKRDEYIKSKGNMHKAAQAMSGQKKVGDKYMREAESNQSKTTMKHISNPNAGEKKAAKDIKPGIKGYRDRIDMLKSAQARGALKKEEVESIDELKTGTLMRYVSKSSKDSMKQGIAASRARDAGDDAAASTLATKRDSREEGQRQAKAKISAAASAKKAVEGKEIAFSGSHQGKTTLKHIKNPDVTQRMAAHDIKPGIKGYRDRIALLKDAGQRKNLKKEDIDLLSDLYNHLDESNQEIFLNQLEEDAEVLLAFAKAMADE